MAGELMSLSASSVVIDVPLFPMPFAMPFTGIVHPNIYILLSFTHPQVVPNLHECLSSAEHKRRYSEECGKQSSSGAQLTSIVFLLSNFQTFQTYKLSSKYIPLCLAEQTNSYRFGTP